MAGKAFQQSLAARAAIQKLPGPGPHRSYDRRRMTHFSDGKDGDVAGGRVDEFNGINRPLRIVGINIDQNDFAPRILDLAQDRVGGAHGKAEVNVVGPAQVGGFEAGLQHG